MRRHRPRTGLATVLGLLVAATTLVAAPGEPAGAAPPTLPAPNSHGLTVVSGPTAVPGKPNQYDITVRTAAVFTPRGTPTTPSDVSVPVKVRVLLPAGYDPDRAQPYDVLYLLHGGGGTYADWSTWGDVAGNLPGFDGIVVMPEGGRAGWYSDWPGRTDGNFAPLWETFHVHQLVPWVDANFNTSGTRSGRAVAGLSMGGYGALRYAGRHPHLFSAVGAFSAGTDINPPGARKIISDSMWQAGAAIELTGLLDGHFRVNPPWFSGIDPVQYRLEAIFGPPSGWPSINPMDLAPAYDAYDGRMAVYAGGLAGSGGETDIGTWNLAFHQRLEQAGVEHRWCGGQGSHDWTWWRRHLRDFVAFAFGTTPSSCPN
ncbi:MAG TPA: alpha/beta hydrolase family protein [Acidimicrobiales bacterium]|nr:alpha/beta hydrolase family protein [Acidimicrobiales bacterium]